MRIYIFLQGGNKLRNIYSIKDKVIVISGATGYLGSAMCEDLSKAGAKVIVLSRNLEKAKNLCVELNISKEQAFKIDVSSNKSIEECFKNIIAKFEKIDILVNNVCFVKPVSFGKYTREDWQINLDGSVVSIDMVTQEVLKHMIPRKKGKIINISSMYGMISPDESIYESEESVNPIAYGVGKAGVIQYTKYAAMKLAKHNINVNCITYGAFPNLKNVKDEKFLEALSKKTFLKRVGLSKEATSAVYFLSLDESSYVTGQNIVVDGGWTSW